MFHAEQSALKQPILDYQHVVTFACVRNKYIHTR